MRREPAPVEVAALLLAAATSACLAAPQPEPPAAPVAKVDRGCVETGETYPCVEVSFRLAGVTGDPFAEEVWAVVERPGAPTVRVPAFYDGGDVWRARYTPDRKGRHRVTVAMGPETSGDFVPVLDLSPAEFDVTGEALPGFVRRSPRHVQRFVLDNGAPYFPLGYNVGWGKPEDFEAHHEAMRAAGIDWSRHWMACFAALALDWQSGAKPLPEGHLDLEVARKWDRIVRSAERNGVRFQLVLQHHGQYSSTVNPNWPDCPWSAAKSGFLARPEEFFTHPKALEITRLKYRYIVARWGYSTAIMAWELFNEVQSCDAWWKGERHAFERAPNTLWVLRPAPEDVYRTCLRRDPAFTIPVPDGIYLLRLHFYCEGEDALVSVDLGRGAVVEDLIVPADEAYAAEIDDVAVTGGRGLEIAFAGAKGDGFCSGLEVVALDGSRLRVNCGPPAPGAGPARGARAAAGVPGWESADRYLTVGPAVVARWHADMAAYIRSLDPWRHLVTTSALGPESPVSAAMDFHQPHVYRTDMIAAVSGFGRDLRGFDKPVFYGEIGDAEKRALPADHVPYDRSMLWAGLMSGGAGAAQQWFWERMPLVYGDYRAARRFVDAAGLAARPFAPVPVLCHSALRAPVEIVPRGGFDAGRILLLVPPDGREPRGLDSMPPYLHGDASKIAAGYAHDVAFVIEAVRPMVFSLDVDTVAKAGAEAELRLDGRHMASVRWPETKEDARPNETLSLRLPRGSHTVSVTSTGKDWFRAGSYRLSGGAPALAGLACSAGDAACVWLYNRLGVHDPSGPVTSAPRYAGVTGGPAVWGTVEVRGLRPGPCDVEWWDTRRGAVFARGVGRTDGSGTLRLVVPPVRSDVAAIIRARAR